jgi:hypothetical protein
MMKKEMERGALFDGDGCAKIFAFVDGTKAALANLLAKVEVLVVDVPRLIEVADQSFVGHLLIFGHRHNKDNANDRSQQTETRVSRRWRGTTTILGCPLI